MENERPNVIGEYLRAKRQERNWWQREVAKRASVAISTVSRVESGELLPTVDLLVRLADALEIDLIELLARMGVETRRALPEFADYLRYKYPELSEECISDVKSYFRRQAHVHVS